MAKINNEMKELLSSNMWVLATADSKGVPNAVPIHFTKVLTDDKLMLVDNFMKKTIANIKVNSQVSVSVWLKDTGYQFKGTATIEKTGTNFDAGVEMVKKANPQGNPKGVVIVKVDSIYITSPGLQAGDKVE